MLFVEGWRSEYNINKQNYKARRYKEGTIDDAANTHDTHSHKL